VGLVLRRRGLERSLLRLMEDSDAKDLSTESLKEEAMIVTELTDRSAVMRWHDLSSDSDMVIEQIGGGASTASLLAWEESSKNTLSSQERELKQAFYNCPNAQISEERLAGDKELQQVLLTSLLLRRPTTLSCPCCTPVMLTSKPPSVPRTLPRTLTRQSFVLYGKFDSFPTFALQFHKYIVNIRVDEVATNVDLAEVARRACLTETSDSSLTGRAFPGLTPAEQFSCGLIVF